MPARKSRPSVRRPSRRRSSVPEKPVVTTQSNLADLATVSPKEAAQIIGVSPETLAGWRCTKRVALPYVKVGKRKVRYRRSDLEAFLSSRVVRQ